MALGITDQTGGRSSDVWVPGCRATHLVAPHDQGGISNRPVWSPMAAGWSTPAATTSGGCRRPQRPSREPLVANGKRFDAGTVTPDDVLRRVSGISERSHRDSEHDIRFGSRVAYREWRAHRRIHAAALAGRQLGGVTTNEIGADGGGTSGRIRGRAAGSGLDCAEARSRSGPRTGGGCSIAASGSVMAAAVAPGHAFGVTGRRLLFTGAFVSVIPTGNTTWSPTISTSSCSADGAGQST